MEGGGGGRGAWVWAGRESTRGCPGRALPHFAGSCPTRVSSLLLQLAACWSSWGGRGGAKGTAAVQGRASARGVTPGRAWRRFSTKNCIGHRSTMLADADEVVSAADRPEDVVASKVI